MEKTIFILEEDQGIQDTMRQVLEHAGHHVTLAKIRDMSTKM